MRYLDLEKHLSAVNTGFEQAKPLYVIAGVDAYLRHTALDMFKALVDEDFKEFNLTLVSQSDGRGAVEDALSMFPMFGDRKVVVVPDVSERLSDDDKKFVQTYVLSPNPTTIFVAVVDDVQVSDDDDETDEQTKKNDKEKKADKDDENEQDKKKKNNNITGLAKTFCSKYGIEFVDCSHLEPQEIANEVKQILDEEPVRKMDPAALSALINFTKSDMSRIVREVQKLKAYSNDVITEKDVENMVVPDSEYAGYMLSSAVSEKQGDRALEILNALYGRGMRGVTIISMLYNHYRKMLHSTLYKGDDKQLCTLLEVSSGQLYHLRRVAKNYTQVRLKKCVDYLHELQYSILTGRRTEESAVHDAILTLLNA